VILDELLDFIAKKPANFEETDLDQELMAILDQLKVSDSFIFEG